MKLPTEKREEGRLIPLLSQFSFALLLVLVLTMPFVEMTGVMAESEKIYRLYGYGVLVGLQALLVFARGWRKSLSYVVTPVLAPLIWFTLSLAWSENFDASAKSLSLLYIVYVTIFTAVMDLGYRRVMRIVLAMLGLALLLNYIVVFAYPDIGMHPGTKVRLWRGFMAHKNIAGMCCALTVMVFTIDGRKVFLSLRFAVIAAASVFLYMTWSKTALIALPIALALGLFLAHMPSDLRVRFASKQPGFRRFVWTIFVLMIGAVVVLTVQHDLFLSFTDDTTAFTKRVAIWRPMLQTYLANPVLGSGYGGFWSLSGGDASASAFANQQWMREVYQAHNGYLDLLVQSGFVGFALAFWAVLARPLVLLPSMCASVPKRAAPMFALFMFFLIENMSESSLLLKDSMGNLFILIVCSVVFRFNDIKYKHKSLGRNPRTTLEEV